MLDYLEIRNHAHLMDFEGSNDKKPSAEEIKQAVFNRGYIASNINITFDDMFGFYRFSGDLSTITQQPLSEVSHSVRHFGEASAEPDNSSRQTKTRAKMKNRIMILPHGDLLVGTPQFIGYSDDLLWHSYWIHNDGDKYVSKRGVKTKRKLMSFCKKVSWSIQQPKQQI